MINQPLISVIMPVYNAEKYIDSATESILSQSYSNIELILVDDGSSDRSGEYCDRIAMKDSRVKVIHQKNKGISEARNTGMEKSEGEYITFCDNDDIFLPNFLKDNIMLAIKNEADVVKFGKRIITTEEGQIISVEEDKFMQGIYDRTDIKKNFAELDAKRYFGFVWDAIYSRKVLNNGDNEIRFDKTFRTGYEDVDFNLSVFNNVDTMVVNDSIYYEHYIRSGYSTTLRYSYNRVESIYKVIDKKFDLLSTLGFTYDDIALNEWLLLDLGEKISSVLSLICSGTSGMNFKQVLDELRRMSKLRYLSIEFDKKAYQNAKKMSYSRGLSWNLLYNKYFHAMALLGFTKKRIIGNVFPNCGMRIR